MPVMYKEKTYNIPICIWLKIDHPNACPMAFVTPTKDMQIKVSHHVDQTGRIYMQYLDEWRYPDSSLTGLLNICRDIFGELPPVFAKSKPASSHKLDSDTTANLNGKCF
jgi:ESCRT-I complex subunit TSG101